MGDCNLDLMIHDKYPPTEKNLDHMHIYQFVHTHY